MLELEQECLSSEYSSMTAESNQVFFFPPLKHEYLGPGGVIHVYLFLSEWCNKVSEIASKCISFFMYDYSSCTYQGYAVFPVMEFLSVQIFIWCRTHCHSKGVCWSILHYPHPPKNLLVIGTYFWTIEIKTLLWVDLTCTPWLGLSQHKNTKATTEHGYVLHTNVGTIFSHDYLLVLTASTLQKRRELLCRWCVAAHVAGVIKTGHTLNALTIWNALVSVQLHILSVQLGNSTPWTTLTCKFVF